MQNTGLSDWIHEKYFQKREKLLKLRIKHKRMDDTFMSSLTKILRYAIKFTVILTVMLMLTVNTCIALTMC